MTGVFPRGAQVRRTLGINRNPLSYAVPERLRAGCQERFTRQLFEKSVGCEYFALLLPSPALANDAEHGKCEPKGVYISHHPDLAGSMAAKAHRAANRITTSASRAVRTVTKPGLHNICDDCGKVSCGIDGTPENLLLAERAN
jgi:hypothetical protein